MIDLSGKAENTKPEAIKPESIKPESIKLESTRPGNLDMQAQASQAELMQMLKVPTAGQNAFTYIEGRLWGDVVINIVGIEGAGSIPDVASATGANNQGASGGDTLTTQAAAQAKTAQVAKSLVDLVPGQVFSAEILDIQPGVINLKLGEGALAARTLASPDARIGDAATFLVRENVPGVGSAPAQITLEFLRGAAVGTGENSQGTVSASIVKEALSAANMQLTGQNGQLIESLVNHNLPIDQNSVQRAAFFRYSMSDAPFAKIAFLMENNFAPTDRTVEVFTKMASGEMNLKSEVANLQRLVADTNFQNPATKEALQTMMSGKLVFEPQPQAQAQNIMQNQAQNQAQNQLQGKAQMPNQTEVTELGKYLTELRGLAQEAAVLLQRSGEDIPIIRQSLENIGDMLDFARNIGETKMFYQFPFAIHGNEQSQHLAELHIFKKKAARKTSGKNATALIGLDMANLGRVEILVSKAGRDVSLQFRTDSGRTIMLVGENKAKLVEMLADKGYQLAGLGIKKIDEKFDISSKEEKKEVQTSQASQVIVPEAKRYSFDMRV